MDGDLIHDCVPAGDSLSSGYRPGVWDLWRVGGHGNGLAGPLSGICGSLSERPVAVSPCDIDVYKRRIKNLLYEERYHEETVSRIFDTCDECSDVNVCLCRGVENGGRA